MEEYQKIIVYRTGELAGNEEEFEQIKNGIENLVKDLGIDYALELQEKYYYTNTKRMSDMYYILVLIIRPAETQRVVEMIEQLDGNYMAELMDEENEENNEPEESEIDPIKSDDSEEDPRTLNEKYKDLTRGDAFIIIFFGIILGAVYLLEMVLMIYNFRDFNVLVGMVILILCELYLYCKTVSNILNKKREDEE